MDWFIKMAHNALRLSGFDEMEQIFSADRKRSYEKTFQFTLQSICLAFSLCNMIAFIVSEILLLKHRYRL